MLLQKLKHYYHNMATLSEIIANRDKLVQSGLSLQDAKQQAYSQARSGAQTVPVSPAPVA